MAQKVRKPPSPSDFDNTRSLEYFLNDLYEQHVLRGDVTVAVPAVPSGGSFDIVIPVKGALANHGQTVEYGLPGFGVWNAAFSVSAYVVSDGNVVISIRNHSGSAQSISTGRYAVRVRP